MGEVWRNLLYFPLGFLPSVFFGARFLIQWLRSEKAGESVIFPLFWKLSVLGSSLAALHYFIQFQYAFGLLQVGNVLIAWRNLELMAVVPTSLSTFFPKAGAIFLFCFGLCVTQEMVLQQTFLWESTFHFSFFRVFNGIVPGYWHLVGMIGQGLFASRFWVQWIHAERKGVSDFGKAFWWISAIGGIIVCTYSLKVGDIVTAINQIFGIIPYTRNLMLLRKTKADLI